MADYWSQVLAVLSSIGHVVFVIAIPAWCIAVLLYFILWMVAMDNYRGEPFAYGMILLGLIVFGLLCAIFLWPYLNVSHWWDWYGNTYKAAHKG
jgi:hypothetical protein